MATAKAIALRTTADGIALRKLEDVVEVAPYTASRQRRGGAIKPGNRRQRSGPHVRLHVGRRGNIAIDRLPGELASDAIERGSQLQQRHRLQQVIGRIKRHSLAPM